MSAAVAGVLFTRVWLRRHPASVATSSSFPHPRNAEVANDDAARASALASVEDLQHQVDELRQDVRRLQAERVAQAEGSASEEDLALPADEEPAFDRMEATVVEEAVDGSWAPQMRRAIAGALRDPAFRGSELQSVECLSTVCKFVVAHDSEEARGAFSDAFAMQGPPAAEVEVRSVGNAEVGYGSVAYLTRLEVSRPADAARANADVTPMHDAFGARVPERGASEGER